MLKAAILMAFIFCHQSDDVTNDISGDELIRVDSIYGRRRRKELYNCRNKRY